VPFTWPRRASCSKRPACCWRATRPAGSYRSPTPPRTRASWRIRSDVHAGTRSFRSVVEGESLRLALDALVLFAHWVTPPSPIEGRRFDARFFVTRVPAEQVPAHDDRETTESVWVTAAEAIRRAAARDIVLPPPTWVTLRELERLPSVDAALAWASARRVARREPVIVNQDDGRVLVMPADSGPDAIAYERRFALRDGSWGPIGGVP
jgi:hypothetical protein